MMGESTAGENRNQKDNLLETIVISDSEDFLVNNISTNADYSNLRSVTSEHVFGAVLQGKLEK